MTKTRLLKIAIMKHDLNTEQTADKLGISKPNLLDKINQKRQFKVNEAIALMDLLGIDYADIKTYF